MPNRLTFDDVSSCMYIFMPTYVRSLRHRGVLIPYVQNPKSLNRKANHIVTTPSTLRKNIAFLFAAIMSLSPIRQPQGHT